MPRSRWCAVQGLSISEQNLRYNLLTGCARSGLLIPCMFSIDCAKSFGFLLLIGLHTLPLTLSLAR